MPGIQKEKGRKHGRVGGTQARAQELDNILPAGGSEDRVQRRFRLNQQVPRFPGGPFTSKNASERASLSRQNPTEVACLLR